MSGDCVAKAENAAGNDACARRRDDDFASGQLRRAWRPDWIPSRSPGRSPWPIEPVSFGGERNKLEYWRRQSWTVIKFAEPGFGGGNRQGKIISEKDKTGPQCAQIQREKNLRAPLATP